MSNIALPKRHFGKFNTNLTETPSLVQEQLKSYKRLLEVGVKSVFEEFSPISDYSGKKFDLDISKFTFGKPEYDEHYAKFKRLSYKIPLRIEAKLTNKTTGEVKTQEIFLADFPYMTDHGTFIINGVERVVVPQLARSYGVFFLKNEMKGSEYFGAKIIPARGAWVEIESEPDGAIYVKIDRKRKFPVTTFLKVFGLEDEKSMLKAFKGVEGAEEVIKASLENDITETTEAAFLEVYKRLRDGDLATAETAKDFVASIFSKERYDLSKVGRYQFNHRFELKTDGKSLGEQVLTKEDVIRIVGKIITLNKTKGAKADDIDHLGFRRVRYVGEMMQHQVRIGMSRLKRNIQDRMSTVDAETTLPVQFINPRPFSAAVMEFFSTNQLSQFMEQHNILGELEHLRTLSALGPGGLTRERAGFDVRDVHTSHYGRLCPIQTPEGQNIGLILRLAVHARLNDFGIIETPYVRVTKGKVTDEIVYMNALDEEKYKIAHAATERDKNGKFMEKLVEVRKKGEPYFVEPKEIEFMEVANGQAFSVATTMIPFMEHDDANRTLMGSNMQKQATPCVIPEIPYVATGIEENAAKDSGRLVLADEAGTVTYADARKVTVKNSKGKEKEYTLVSFSRTNNMSMFHQRVSVSVGDKVKVGDTLADTSSSVGGQIAIGQNARVAFMSWAGANYEDAIVISERLVKASKFTSIHVEEFVSYVRDTKLGAEVTTYDIPNVSEIKLKNLDEEGIVRIGAEVRSGDILVGKVTPKGETQLTPEERLLRSIFGEKAKDVKDTSLRMEAGKRGRVVKIRIFSRENGDHLES
ncbi:DNA-directed RNA polymerase subunit beta, partial [Candidatus Kaiserbacteria bacterium]